MLYRSNISYIYIKYTYINILTTTRVMSHVTSDSIWSLLLCIWVFNPDLTNELFLSLL